MTSLEFDIESPKSVDLSQEILIKEDDDSVSTHQSDSERSDEADSPSRHDGRENSSVFRKVAIIALLAAIVGLVVGLSVGINVGRDESPNVMSQSNQAPEVTATLESITSDNQDVLPEEGQEPGVALPVEEPTTIEQPSEPDEEQPVSTRPPFGGVGIGSGQKDVSWPDLVGLSGEEAKQIIEDENRGYFVVIVPFGHMTTKDLREDRVFIFVNEEGFVSLVPTPFR